MKKDGDLRLLKDGVVFGPTDRQGLEKLLAAGRITSDDRVSVRNADWIRIGDYLAAPPAPPRSEPMPATQSVAPAPRKKKGELRVLAGGRVISSLHRDDVERLWKSARVGEDDLVCALDGPWMRVGDFFASPPPAPDAPPAPVAAAPVEVPPAALAPIPLPIPAPMPASPPSSGETPFAVPVQLEPVAASPQLAPVVLQPSVASADAGYRVRALRPPPPSVSDEWFVRVRGVHSAPLRKYHVKALFQAREITLDNVARHPTWPENDWRPIGSIAALADIGRP